MAHLEQLINAAIDVPIKPGVFTIDYGAMRTLLLEIGIRLQQQSGESSSSLKASNEKLAQEMDTLQYNVKQLQKEMAQFEIIFDTVNRLEDNVSEIRENERIISDSIDMLATNLEAVEEQMDQMADPEASTDGAMNGKLVAELMERIDVLEKGGSAVMARGGSGSGARRKSVTSKPRRFSVAAAISGPKKSVAFRSSRMSFADDVRGNINTLSRKLSPDPMPPEPKVDMAAPFVLLKDKICGQGLQAVTAVEDFLSNLKNTRVIQPKMLEELIIVLSGLPVDFFSLVVSVLNKSESLTVDALTEILEFVLSSPFNPTALVRLFEALSAADTKLTSLALYDLLCCVKTAEKLTSTGLTDLLAILVKCKGLIPFLKQVTELEYFSWKSLMNIMEEIHFSKNSTLQELVVISKRMSAAELQELMQMLLTIPGYVNELMHSLPQTPSLSTQRLLEHLISLPDDSPHLLVQLVELVVHTPTLKDSLTNLMASVLDLTAIMERETRSVDNGFYQLLKMLHDSEHIDFDCLAEVFKLLSKRDGLSMEAIKALVQITRDSSNDFVEAFTDLVQELLGWPGMKGELILRLLHLIDKAKYITPRYINELLRYLQNANLLTDDIFDQVLAIFRESELNSPYMLSDFLAAIPNIDFLTLEDLAFTLTQNHAANVKAYAEAVEKNAKREQELKELQQKYDASHEDLHQDLPPSTGPLDEKLSEEMQQLKTVQNNILDKLEGLNASISSPTLPQPSTVTIAPQPAEVQDPESWKTIADLQADVRDLHSLVAALVEDKVRSRDTQALRPTSKERPKKRGKVPSATPEMSVTPDPSLMKVDQETSDEREEEHHETGGSDTTVRYFSLNLALKEEAERLDGTISRLEKHEEMCRNRYEWLLQLLSVKVEATELSEFKQAVKQQLHNFIKKRIPASPAGTKQQLRSNCLSCDKKAYSGRGPPEHPLPMKGAFPPIMSQRPRTIFEMDAVRRHARSLLEGKNEQLDYYSIPRQCGGQHTSVNVRHTWTYEFHQRGGYGQADDAPLFSSSANRPSNLKLEMVRGTKTPELLSPHPPKFSPQPPNDPNFSLQPPNDPNFSPQPPSK